MTSEKRRQVEYEASIQQIRDDGSLSEDEKNQLIRLQSQLNGLREANANPLKQYMDGLQEDLSNINAMVVQMAQTIQTELSNAMSSAVIGVIEGTKTVEEAFSEMFANIGKAFIQMATEMITKALVMKALGILTSGGTSGTPTPQFDLFNSAPEGFNNIGPMTRFEGGLRAMVLARWSRRTGRFYGDGSP